MVVGGTSDRINPPIPADCRPLCTRAMNNRVTVMINPTVQVATRNVQHIVGRVSLLHEQVLHLQHAWHFLSKADTNRIEQTILDKSRVTMPSVGAGAMIKVMIDMMASVASLCTNHVN